MSHLLSILVLKLGAYETVSLPLTAAMIALAIWDTYRPIGILSGLETALGRIASNPALALAVILGFAIGGPLALRPFIGIPHPYMADEFSLMLQAKTYLRGRLVNDPVMPNFEQPLVMLRPTYVSHFPVLRSLPMALGEAAGIGAWGGVLASVALLALAVFWMTRVWIGPGFALVAALLVTLRFGLFTLWINSYLGPAFTALGGVLLLGGYKILRSRPTLAGGAALGTGALILLTTRPYEGILFAAPLAGALAVGFVRDRPEMRRASAAPAAVAFILLAFGLGLTFAHNQAATGDWKVFPYTLLRQEMGTPPAWFIERRDPDEREVARYDWSRRNFGYGDFEYNRGRTIAGVLAADAYRFRNYWNFYLGAALTLPFVFGLWSLRRDPPVLISAALLGLGLAIGSFDFAHYAAPGFGFVILAVMLGFRELRAWRPFRRPLGLSLSRTLPLGLILAAAVPLRSAIFGPVTPIFHNDAVNVSCCWLRPRSLHTAVTDELGRFDGRHLVVVDTGPSWPALEVPVANEADLDGTKTIFVNADPEFDRQTIDRYSGRRIWRLGWMEGEGPCLQALKAVTSAPGAPLDGVPEDLANGADGGWRRASVGHCPGGLTHESWVASSTR